MSQAAKHILLGISVLLPTVATAADLDEVTIQVIDLDAERPEAVTRQIELPADRSVESGAKAAAGSAADATAPAVGAKGGRDHGGADVSVPALDLQTPDAAPASSGRSEGNPARASPGRPGADAVRPSERAGRPDAAGRPDVAGRPESPGRPGRADIADRPETSGRPDRPSRPGTPEPPDIYDSGQSERPDHGTGLERAQEVGGAARARDKGQGRP